MDACGVLGGDAAGSAAGGCAVGREKPGGDGGNGVLGAEPHEGMEFGSYDEAAAFYYGYARRAGFRVSKKSSRRSKLDNCFVEVKFVCSRYGKKHEKPHALYRRHSGKVGCGAAMFVRKREVGTRWFVYYLVREHNHELVGRKLPESPGELEAPLVNDGRVLISVVDAQHLLEFFTRIQEEKMSRGQRCASYEVGLCIRSEVGSEGDFYSVTKGRRRDFLVWGHFCLRYKNVRNKGGR